jgi:adenylate kinase family enzyme
MIAPLVILTGASGAGKTTLARHFLENYSADCDVFFFDSIGVPPVHKMEADYGSGEVWQRAMTFQWMARIRSVLSVQRPVLFEGQMRIAFIREALAAHEITTAHIVLLDCDDVIRAARLHLDRSQPELANSIMMNWARYLRQEALELGVETLDTGHESFDGCIAHLKPLLFGGYALE